MTTIQDLSIDAPRVQQAIVAFIHEQVHQAGYGRVLLGLSGGIDSALACYLAAEALGPENVLALLMPCRTSNPSSEADAMLIINDLGIPWHKAPITPMMDAFLGEDPAMDARRQGNIMSRLRMVLLYDQSVVFGGLVLGTSNRTEMLLGYFTLHGDSAAALRPLANLYKCQVRQLAAQVGVPHKIIAKPPSADLWQGQTDEGELGFTYDEADRILHLHVDRKLGAEEIARAGFDLDLVRRVLGRMKATAFKRSTPCAPDW